MYTFLFPVALLSAVVSVPAFAQAPPAQPQEHSAQHPRAGTGAQIGSPTPSRDTDAAHRLTTSAGGTEGTAGCKCPCCEMMHRMMREHCSQPMPPQPQQPEQHDHR